MDVQTVLGPVPVQQLGRTLMHEHIFVAFPGAEFDPQARFDRRSLADEAVRRLTELRERCSVRTFVDPCPIELGRDVGLMREVSERSGVHIVCATGFYYEDMGIPPYWRKQPPEDVAHLYLRELQDGIGDTGIRAGLIKVATDAPAITPVESAILKAACIAQRESGAPILTHTNAGLCGPEQQARFAEEGVPMHRCLIGHCCANPNAGYHLGIARRGSYVGFDRIGKHREQLDTVRADNIVKLVRAGHGSQVMLSQDSICGYRGKLVTLSPQDQAAIARHGPRPMTHLFDVFLPMLKERGLTDAEIASILEDNPRRYFAGEPPPVA